MFQQPLGGRHPLLVGARVSENPVKVGGKTVRWGQARPIRLDGLAQLAQRAKIFVHLGPEAGQGLAEEGQGALKVGGVLVQNDP